MGNLNADLCPQSWNVTTWGELVELKYGKGLKGYRESKGAFPVYGTNGPVGWCEKPLCDYSSVIVGRKGAYRGVHFSDKPFYVIDTAFYIQPKIDINLKWAYYSLLLADINGMDSGSAIPSTSREDFYAIPVRVPPRAIQESIVYQLDMLDNKIQLNRQTNQTLEQMAQALFKSWFVDFDPVIDNALAAGKPIPEELQARAQRRQQQLAKADHQPLPDDVLQLFPSEFEETEELGWVPKGWECSYISDFCSKIQNGGTPKRSESKFWDDGCIPWLASGEVRQSIITKTKSFITEDGLAKSSAKIVPKGTTVIAMYGATAGQVAYSAIDMSTNQAVCSLIPRKGTSYFVYLTMERLVIELEKQARGSAQQNISKGIIEETILLYPSAELLNYFDDVVRPIFDKWEASIKSNESLSKLRDTLLPKLISGELRLPESMLESETNPAAETAYE